MQKKKIGFIGTGVMGKCMAEHLINAGYQLHIFTRTKAKAEDLINLGATWENSVVDVAKNSDIIITMIGTPQDVENVYLGDQGLINNAKPYSYLIDMTTSKPSLAKEIYTMAKEKDIYVLDAPVSGGDVGAIEARLTIMVGGEREVFDYLYPLFKKMGKNIILQGGAGAGQHTKLVNQISIAPGMIGLSEALVYAKKAGLDAVTVLQSISTGAAGSWSMSNYGPRMIEGNFAPGFAVKHYIKDMNIALDSADELNLSTPGLKLALHMYEQLAENGENESGIHALIKYFDDM